MRKLLPYLLLCFCWSVRADEKPDVREFDELIPLQSIQNANERVRESIPKLLFDAIDDIKILTQSIGPVDLDMSVHRDVYDNRDVQNSWTVADRAVLGASLPLFSEVLETLSSQSSFGIYVGLKGALDFINIRQVTPEGYEKLPSVERVREELHSQPPSQEFTQENSPDSRWIPSAVTTFEDPNNPSATPPRRFLSLIPWDPENQARYSRFWNTLFFPIRIPLKASRLKAMEKGEILSYATQGSIEAGPYLGLNLDISGISQVISGQISYSVYIQGIFRVSILKEDEDHVQVKITRTKNLGHGVGIGSGYRPDILDGMFLVQNVQNLAKVIPFKVNISQNLRDSFDVGYRYDLTQPQAKEAYEQMVLGRTKLSDELALLPDGTPRETPIYGVQRVFTRTAFTRGQNQSHTMRVGFLFHRRNRINWDNIDAVIELPSGKRHLFQSVVSNSKEWKLFWGAYEKFRYNFAVQLDLDEYQNNPQSTEALSLIADGLIDDSNTSGDEMMRYILETENAIGKFGVFPRPPRSEKDIKDPVARVELPKGRLGQSRFAYQIGITQPQLQKIIYAEEDEKWGILEKAFGVPPGTWSSFFSRLMYQLFTSPLTIINVPLYIADLNIREGSTLLHARYLKSRWDDLGAGKDLKTQAEHLGHLFFDRLFSYEMIKLMRILLKQEEVEFTASGSNRVFGRIWDNGKTRLLENDYASQVQRQIDFDRLGPRGPGEAGNPTARSRYQIKRMDVRQIGENVHELRFEIPQRPEKVSFELWKEPTWLNFGRKRLIKIQVSNVDLFEEGENRLLLDSEDPQSTLVSVAKFIERGKEYKLKMAFDPDGLGWGPTNEVIFETQ